MCDMRGKGKIRMKKLFCVLLSQIMILSSFIPLAAADCTMYASDGRTIVVSDSDAEAYRRVGWYDSEEDARLYTMYAEDGRTIEVPGALRADYRAVGWFDNESDVKITMYAADGRTLSVLRGQAEEYRKVGWFYNLSDVAQTMYAADGRTLTVLKTEVPLYKNVGWYENMEDVTVTMYDTEGNAHTVFIDNRAQAEQNGWSTDADDCSQLMFSDDGRTIRVPFDKVEAYMNVGWYRGGGKVDASRPMLALTFDDGPGKYTDKILSCLEKYGARATFFVQGKNVSGYASAVNRAVRLGCEIGNHTWSHIQLSGASGGEIGSQISRTNNAVYNAAGVYPRLYRPPYGSYNSAVLASVAMPAILWNVDTLDWKTRNAAKTIACVQNEASDGSVILMHDIHAQTADAVERIVPMLLKNGYQLVTVSELFSARKGGAVNGRAYRSAK